nr:disease resistance protein RGA5-like [Setaria viridis]
MYAEDHDIEKDELVMQWVAEGFVCGIDGRDALKIAGSYFNELVNRSMIIKLVEHLSWRTERIYHKVHDMVLDLILSKSAEENFLCVVENIETITRRQHRKTRRLSLQLGEAGLDKIAPRMSLTHVRSLCIFGLHHRSIELLELKFIRALFICKVDGLDLTPIGKLSQLRYLNVQSSYHGSSMQLPKQICGLHHLETLVIHGPLYQLSHDIVHLPALSYLKVSACIAYPDGISKMKSLHTLKWFDPSKQSVDNLRALGELLNLRELYMRFTDHHFATMETHKDALFYSIQKLLNGNLRHFTVSEFNQRHTGSYDGWNSLCLSDCRLEQLHLQFSFPRLPMWVGQLSTLSSLEIHVDELCKDDISVLAGLPALAHLVLGACYVPGEGIVFSSSAVFRSLDYFESRRPGHSFHFQAGAVPKVETLRFVLGVREVKTCGIRLAGVEHLTNLKSVAIGLGYSWNRSEESDVPMIEAAIRTFFDEHHPGRPVIHVTSYLYTLLC